MTNKNIDQLVSGCANLNKKIYDAIDHHEQPQNIGDYVCIAPMEEFNGLNSAIYRDETTNKSVCWV